MDIHSVMETFAEAWVAANTQTPLTEAAEQGLINGPNNTTTNGPPVLTVLQDVSNERRDIESINDGDSCRLPGRQSPTDSQSNCTTLSELKSPYKTLSNPHGKSLPVHCIIEQIPGPQACGQYVELDSYAIVPDSTLFSDLIRTALGKLGYSGAQILGARGAIQIKKWKPLAFDQITENPEATVADILGELTTVASLHIRLYSVPDDPQQWIDTTVRNAVLELLREMSQSKLSKICPLSQPMLSNIINNRYMGKIGKEKCQEFGTWYLSYRKEHPEGSTPEVIPNERPSDGRLTFHPTKELPLMRDWFHSCRNPSRRTLQMYVDILNQGPVRQQERPKISLSTLKNWWKNEKQRERKNLKPDEQAPDAPKVKRKKKAVNINNPKPESVDNNVQPFSGSNSQETAKANKFTLINHNEPESEIDKFARKESEMSVNNRLNGNPLPLAVNPLPLTISPLPLTVNPLPLIKDHEEPNMYHKLHNVCLDNNHVMFGFPDPHLNHQNHIKVYCDNPHCIPRTSTIDANAASRISSEDDVDEPFSINRRSRQLSNDRLVV